MGDLNLIPANRLSKKRLRARVGAWVVICAVVISTIAAAVGSANYHLRGATGTLGQQIEAADLDIQRYSLAASDLSAKISRATRELKIAQATGIQPDWGKLLSLLAAELGDEVVLSSCHLIESDTESANAAGVSQEKTESVAQAQLPGQRYELRLSGFGRSQMSASDFLLRLERMEFFRSVRLLSSNRRSFLDGHAVAFTVVCTI
jgi:Tfp pilus assembly protein PilN